MPSKADLNLYQGDDYGAVVTVTGIQDLTGYTPAAQIRTGPADTNPQVVVEIDAVLVPPTTINLTITHDITVKLKGAYVWDLQVTDPSGIVTTLLAGSVTVALEVTRESP